MKDIKRQELIHQAEEWVRRGRPKRALALYLKVLKANPDDPRVLNRAGDLCARLSRNTEAVSFYKRAAGLLSQQGFHDKAIALCKMIIRLDPTLVEVMETLAKLQASQGLVHEAVSQYEAVGEFYRQSSQPRRAIEAQQAIVELQPNDPSRRLELANLYQQHGRPQEALAQYRGISAVLISHGRAEEARQVCVKALEIDPSDLDFVAEALVDLSASGYPEEAGRLLEAAIARNPEARHLEDRLRSGEVVSPAEPEPAATELELELEIELPEVVEEISTDKAVADRGDDFIDIAAELQAELEQEEEWQAAEPASPLDTQSLVDIVEGLSVEATASAADEDCDTHFSLGIAYQDMELIDEAVGQFQKAAKDPRFLVESASRLARCFVEKGYPKLAIKWLEKGLESPTLVEEAADGLRAQLAEIRGSVGEGNPGRVGGGTTLAPDEIEVLARLSELDSN
jgi:tetratricopeptide (TPR) repeat protein